MLTIFNHFVGLLIIALYCFVVALYNETFDIVMFVSFVMFNISEIVMLKRLLSVFPNEFSAMTLFVTVPVKFSSG